MIQGKRQVDSAVMEKSRQKFNIFWLIGAILLWAVVVFSVKLAVLAALALVLFFIVWRNESAFFYFLAAYLPFQIALNPLPGVDLMSGRILIVALFLVLLLKNGPKFLLDAKKAGLFLLLFLVLCLVSLAGADDWWRGARKIVFFASIFPLVFITAWLIKGANKIEKLANIIVFSAAVCAVLGLAQFGLQFYLGPEKIADFTADYIAPVFYGQSFGELVVQNPSWQAQIGGKTLMRAIGIFPDPHMFSFFMGFGSLLALAAAIFCPKRKLFFFFAFILCSLALLLTFSRGGYLGFAAGLGAFFFIAWPKLDLKAKRLFKSFLGAAAVCAFVWGAPVASRFVSSFDASEGSNAGRLEIWRESFSLGRDNIFTGAGLGNYPLALNPYENYRSAVTSHNLYLDILAEIGIFGLIAWLLFMFYCFKNSLQKAKSGEWIYAAAGAGCFGFFAYFLVHSFFETAIFNPTILAILMIAAGISAAKIDGFPSFRRGYCVLP